MSKHSYLIIRSTYVLSTGEPTGRDYKSIYSWLAFDSLKAASDALKSIKGIKRLEYEYDFETDEPIPVSGHREEKLLDIEEDFRIISVPLFGLEEAQDE